MGANHIQPNIQPVTRGVHSDLVGTWEDEQIEECAWIRMARWRNRARRYSLRAHRMGCLETLTPIATVPLIFLSATRVYRGVAATHVVPIAGCCVVAASLPAWCLTRRKDAQREADAALSRYNLWRGVYMVWQAKRSYHNIAPDYDRLAQSDPVPYKNERCVVEHDAEGSEKELLLLQRLE
jgi:hypothetical protein